MNQMRDESLDEREGGRAELFPSQNEPSLEELKENLLKMDHEIGGILSTLITEVSDEFMDDFNIKKINVFCLPEGEYKNSNGVSIMFSVFVEGFERLEISKTIPSFVKKFLGDAEIPDNREYEISLEDLDGPLMVIIKFPDKIGQDLGDLELPNS